MGPYRCLTAGSDHRGTVWRHAAPIAPRSCSCSVARLVEELTRPELLDKISAPMLIFKPINPTELDERWRLGAHRFRLLVGGRVSIGEHTIDVRQVAHDPDAVATDPLVWHDAGYSDLIRVWDHKVTLTDFYGMTRYTDLVEIHAGPLTIPAWLFAKAFYAHRQRRLNRLVAADFALIIWGDDPQTPRVGFPSLALLKTRLRALVIWGRLPDPPRRLAQIGPQNGRRPAGLTGTGASPSGSSIAASNWEL